MLPPSILLTDPGTGGESIAVYSDDYGVDERGNYIQTEEIEKIYPAIITRSASSPSSAIPKMDSQISYTIMLYCDDAEGARIHFNEPMTFTDRLGTHTVKAQGESIMAMRGAYQFSAVEIGAEPDDTPNPLPVGG